MSNDERNLIEEMHEGQREMALAFVRADDGVGHEDGERPVDLRDAARARRAAAPATSTG